MKITFVNVGYGESMLLECPASNCLNGTFVMLIDGGSGESEEYQNSKTGRIPLIEYVERHGIDHIDLCLSTHTHEDHMCGMLPVAQKYPPKMLWQSLSRPFCREVMRKMDLDLAGDDIWRKKLLRALNDWQTLMELTEAHGGNIISLRAGMSGELCPDLHYRVLGPDNSRLNELEQCVKALYAEIDKSKFQENLTDLHLRLNNFSLILLLEYKGTRLLLPGDTTITGYEGVELPKADLFKVGKHGQIDGADQEIIEKIQPQCVVCTASSDRRYNSAHPELLTMFQEHGATTWFSDCPVPNVPPHHAVIFSIGADGAITGEYGS